MFNYLDKMAVTEANTVEYELPLYGDPTPVLFLRPATSLNKAYFNAALKAHKHLRGVKQIGRKVLDEAQERDRELYPKYVITGWSGILNDKGEEVEFCIEACMEFFRKIPDWILNDIRDFAATPSNFTEQIDAEELAGN